MTGVQTCALPICDGFIFEVSDTVEEEEVGAQLLSGGPGFDAGEVDVADRKSVV